MKSLEEYKHTLQGFFRDHKRMPSYAEAAKLFKVASKDSSYRIIQKLVSAGVVSKDASGKLIPHNLASGLKMLGVVEAGFPTPAEEDLLDTITLDNYLIGNREASFILRVKGDSMIDAGIHQGDLVIVERSTVAKPGSIVIAEVDGAWTMKYLRKKGSQLYLEAANSSYNPIYPKHSLSITAVVKAVIRKYE
jgi:SOS regulatory protein LexA